MYGRNCRDSHINDAADTWYDLSAWGTFQQHERLPGSHFVRLKEGKAMADLTKILAKGVDKEKLFLQSKVVSIAPIKEDSKGE